MPMAQRERIGALILIGLMCILGLLLVFLMDRPDGPGRGFNNNVIVQQRLINLKKSK